MDITFLLIHFFSFIFQLFSSKRGIGLPITNFMENGQAQYKWMNDFDYLVAVPKGLHNTDSKQS